MAEPGAKLRIEQRDLSPMSTRVWLNEQEITSSLMGLSLTWGPEQVTEATITIGVREVEIDAQTIVHLLARSQEPALLEHAIRTLNRAKAELSDGLSE
jgi:hypothetical protein